MPGIFRNINIIKELNAASSDQILELYQPGWLNSLDVVNNAKYSGFLTSLRLTIDISSINELETIPSDVLASDATISANSKETFQSNQKKCVSFYMRSFDTPLIKVVDIYLFNQRPFYYVDVLPYFTSSTTLDIAPDTQICVQVREVGNGLLQNDDRVLILGTGIEESPTYDQSALRVE
jgi:hypothetical protein